MKDSIAFTKSGFTVTELTVSMLVTSLVISLAGIAVATLIANNRSSQNEQEAKEESLRALTFISSEAKQATKFERDTSSAPTFEAMAAATPGITEIPVVILNTPELSENIIFYLRPAEPPWTGQALFRWGPTFGEIGEYQNPTSPTLWRAQLLLDHVSQNSSSPNCHGWTPIPTAPTGFYSCIEPENRIAEFALQSDLVNFELKTKSFARAINP